MIEREAGSVMLRQHRQSRLPQYSSVHKVAYFVVFPLINNWRHNIPIDVDGQCELPWLGTAKASDYALGGLA